MLSSEWRNFLSYKKVPNTDFNLYLRRIHLIRGTTQIGLHPLTRILTYTPPDNGCGLRQSLLPAMCFAPVSDLPSKVHSAIPSILQSHHLQLSVISAKCLLLFLIGLSLLVLIIMRQNGFVNHFFQTICNRSDRGVPRNRTRQFWVLFHGTPLSTLLAKLQIQFVVTFT